MSLPLGQEPTTDGQEPAEPTTQSTTPPTTGQEPVTFSADYVAELRREAAKNRKAAADAEAKLKAVDDAKLSETERLTKRTAELEAQLASANAAHESALIRAAVEREAHQQGAVKADVVYRLVDRSAIVLDDSGDVKGADRAVKALLEAEPYLLKATSTGTTAVPGTPRPNGQGPNREAQIAEALKEMEVRYRLP